MQVVFELLFARPINPQIFHRGVVSRVILGDFDAMPGENANVFHHCVPLIEHIIRNLNAVEDRRTNIKVGANEVPSLVDVVRDCCHVQLHAVLERFEKSVYSLADEVPDADERLAASGAVDADREEHVDPHVLFASGDAGRDEVGASETETVPRSPFRDKGPQLIPLLIDVLDHFPSPFIWLRLLSTVSR